MPSNVKDSTQDNLGGEVVEDEVVNGENEAKAGKEITIEDEDEINS